MISWVLYTVFFTLLALVLANSKSVQKVFSKKTEPAQLSAPDEEETPIKPKTIDKQLAVQILRDALNDEACRYSMGEEWVADAYAAVEFLERPKDPREIVLTDRQYVGIKSPGERTPVHIREFLENWLRRSCKYEPGMMGWIVDHEQLAGVTDYNARNFYVNKTSKDLLAKSIEDIEEDNRSLRYQLKYAYEAHEKEKKELRRLEAGLARMRLAETNTPS